MYGMNSASVALQRARQKESMQRVEGKNQTFHFRNELLKELWEKELVGQISDGMWENTVNSGWVYWCNVQTVADGSTRLEKSIYGIKANFAFTKLIEYVGDEMMEIVHKYEPHATEKDLRIYLREISDAMKAAK